MGHQYPTDEDSGFQRFRLRERAGGFVKQELFSEVGLFLLQKVELGLQE